MLSSTDSRCPNAPRNQFAAAALAQIGQADADDQERLEAFPQSDTNACNIRVAGSYKLRISLSLEVQHMRPIWSRASN
jgi:hypothetical protein